MVGINKHIKKFFKTKIQSVEVYNEFSLQHELGIYLRSSLQGYKIQFERNLEHFKIRGKLAKKEIDISIFNNDMSEKYAIELKYQSSGRVPDTMFDCVVDVQFAEQLKSRGFTNVFCVAVFLQGHSGGKEDGIYKYFRKEHSIYGNIYGQTGSTKNKCIYIEGKHDFLWNAIDGKNEKYYIIKV